MPRVKCNKCQKAETILKSGFIRGRQRYYCKECNYNFTLHHTSRETAGKSVNHQTTIIDIAKALGVSNSTVSRALRDNGDISSKTREAVKVLAEKMDYQPNLLAQSFVSKQTHTIGVIIPNLESTFFSIMLSGIENIASNYGYKVMICQSNETHTTEVANIQTLMTNWIDGLLICHSLETSSFEHIKLQMNKGKPIIHFYRVCMDTATSKVIADDRKGAEVMMQHLVEQGCKRIAIIVGSPHLLITTKKLQGYKQILKEHDYPFDEGLVAYTDFRKATINKVVDQWLELAAPPDAIFSISDKCAVYAMMRLKEKKIRIPDEICVAGFGNDPMGEVIEPGLTTFNSNTMKIGETAAELFFEQILADGTFTPKTKMIKGNIIVRGSTLRTT